MDARTKELIDGEIKRIKEIFSYSELSTDYQNLFLYTCEKKFNADAAYLSVGDIYEFKEKCLALYHDLKDIKLSKPKRLLPCLFFRIISRFTDHDQSVYDIIIEETFGNDQNREAILNAPSANSAYVSFMKYITPYYNELMSLIQEHKSIEALKKYREIIEILNRHAIPEHYNREKIEAELKKRYHYSSYKSFYGEYMKQMRNPSFNAEEHFNIEHFSYMTNYFNEAVALQKYLHTKMLEHYHSSHCLFRQLTSDVNLYYIGNVLIVAYKYDDIPDMGLKANQLLITWKDPDFWVKMFDPNMKFATHPDTNYYIEHENSAHEQYKIVHSKIPGIPSLYHYKVIIAPEEHIEEAYYNSLTENNTLPADLLMFEYFNKIGFNYTNIKNKLLTPDCQFFFKDPKLVDELKVKNLSAYKSLKQIIEKDNPTSRKRCLATMRTYVRKNPKKPSELPVIRPIAYRKNNSNRRWWND